MKKLLILAISLLFLCSCEEKTRLTIPDSADLSKISWTGFNKYCGPNNLKRAENFKKVKGQMVTWTGKVFSVKKDEGAEEMRNFDSHIIRVKMPGTKSLMADVTLRIPSSNIKHRKYKKDDYVAFYGKISYLGSNLNDHIIEVEKYKKVNPKKNSNMSSSLCPCGSKKKYEQCCQLYHNGQVCPTTETLLRARFTAFVKYNSKFLIDTHHPYYITPQLISDLEDKSFTPSKLKIITKSGGDKTDLNGSITYSFDYSDGQRSGSFTTTSVYSKIGDNWFYEKDP